jgi:fructosamine-3-kinase
MPSPDAVLRSLGVALADATPLTGGSTAATVRASSSSGSVVIKRAGTRALPGAFLAEGIGLQWLATAAMPVPEVLAMDQEMLVLSHVPTTTPSRTAAQRFGRDLARMHQHAAAAFGAEPHNELGQRPVSGWVGAVPVPYAARETWGVFYARDRLLPTAAQAADRGGLSAPQLKTIRQLAEAVETCDPAMIGPPRSPAVVHGDLWAGNLLWGEQMVTVIDPAAHGGHPESDIAMLHLFGAPHLEAIMASYQQEQPLAKGWQARMALHQVFPLLVHAAMFAGPYGDEAAAAARTALQLAG